MNWKPIPSAPGYEASDDGQIRSLRRGKPALRKLDVDKFGYLRFRRCSPETNAWLSVHTAVAEAHIGPRPAGMQIRHLDGNARNNRVENLAYGTASENIRDQVLHGTHTNSSKTHCAQGHPFDEANTYRWGSNRYCRTCNRENVRRFKARKRVAA